MNEKVEVVWEMSELFFRPDGSQLDKEKMDKSKVSPKEESSALFVSKELDQQSHSKPKNDDISASLGDGSMVFWGKDHLNDSTSVFTDSSNDKFSYFKHADGLIGKVKVSNDVVSMRLRTGFQPPSFNKSPHVRESIKTLEITPPKMERFGEKPEYSWATALLPQLLMLIVMVAVFFLTGGGSLYFTVPMYVVTIFVGILGYRSQLKKYKKRKANAEKVFEEQLEDAKRRVDMTKNYQAHLMHSEYPSIDDCQAILRAKSERLWRLDPDEDDFLKLRLGIGSVPAAIQVQSTYGAEGCEELLEMTQQVENVPVCCPIREYGVVGVSGDYDSTSQIVRNLLIQAAINHGYDDLCIVVFYPKSLVKDWDWVRWLPHTWDLERQHRYIACNNENAKNLCNELEAILSTRSNDKMSGMEDERHYLVVIADPTLVRDQTVKHFLLSGDETLNVSTVLVGKGRSSLSSACRAIIECNHEEGKWYETANAGDVHKFRADRPTVEICEAVSREMAPIRLVKSVTNSKMPGGITFLEGYKVKTVDELNIEKRWLESRYDQSLAVPIGIRSNGEPFYFDINRKKHGAHGMVAGGTGSGKSDLVQSWILSMALNYKPTEVSFIIIDYKGDGLLAPFRKLPHLVGTISNLDNNVARNVVALNSELERRQMLFKECGAHNIEDYIVQFMHGQIEEPLPYLIVVIDEFADFKANHPEFIPIVNAIYTKGASLGVYCIILAQDAAAASNGTVIPVNSHFRWCMKVDSDEASTGMLETHDAYTMVKLPGRGFVKVGNFEVYEKIQAFWSGAYYNPNRNEDDSKVPPIARVELDGTREFQFGKSHEHGFWDNGSDDQGSGKDGKGGRLRWEESIGLWSSEKEIDEVVRYISAYAKASGALIPAQVWQPPMEKTLYLDSLIETKFDGMSWPDHTEFVVDLGMIDDPEGQRQMALSYQLDDCGHISIQGGPESGKTNALLTAAMSLSQKYSPEDVEIYLLDHDKWALNLLVELPHVKGSTAGKELQEIDELADSIRAEINRRKVLFLKSGIISHGMYCEMVKKIPAIVLLIDNIAMAWEQSVTLQEMLYEVAQKGAGYGIYMIATSPGTSFPYKLVNFFKTKLSLLQSEKGDYTGIVGKTEVLPEEYPGRGLVKLKHPVEIQIALPVRGADEKERSKKINSIVKAMKNVWIPKEKEMDGEDKSWRQIGSVGQLTLGIDRKMLDPVYYNDANKHVLLISSVKMEALESQLVVLANQINEIADAELVVFDNQAESMKGIKTSKYYALSSEEKDVYVRDLMSVMNERDRNRNGKHQPIYLLISDLREFFEAATDETIRYLIDIVELGSGLSVHLIAGGVKDGITYLAKSGEKLTNRIIRMKHLIMMGGSIVDHGLIQTSLPSSQEKEPIGDGIAVYMLGEKIRYMDLLED